MMELTLRKKLFYFFPVLFCFCLPFGSLLLSVIIILWTFTSFFNIDKEQLKRGFLNKQLLLFYLFFLITLISSVFSANRVEALFAVEIKMGLLLFPYLLFCFKWPIPILKRCVVAFVSGCFFASLYLILRAFLYSLNGQPEYFFYTKFSEFIHASYFAMYLILAITFVTLLYGKWFSAHRTVIYSSWFFVAIFVTTIFLCSSKMGLITLCICIPLLVLYRWRNSLNYKNLIIGASVATVIVFVAAFVFRDSLRRMKSLTAVSASQIDKTSSESTRVRMLIWEQAIRIVRKNVLFGVGVGDANDHLYRAYEENGLTGALEHRLNAHNQYLQTFIGMGLPGIIVLLLINLGGLVHALRSRHFFLLIFSILIILNFMVESMLQRSDGMLFFCFFHCFNYLVNEHELKDEDNAALE
jgi:O-antigen ligase